MNKHTENNKNNEDEISGPVALQVEKFIDTQQNEPELMKGNLGALKLIPFFFSLTECEFFRRLIAENEMQQMSNRKRLMFESESVAKWFWTRLQRYNPFQTVIDEHGDTWKATSINPRFRLVRYEEGDSFREHEDGFHWPSWNKKTFATAMVYLNTLAYGDGGSTHFTDIHVDVAPAEGLLVLFLVDNLMHSGQKCQKEKFLLRTDVYYELVTPQQVGPRSVMEFFERREQIFCDYQKLLD